MHVPGFAADIGAWCNGNTWVSKTFVEGSSPSAPAKSLENESSQGLFFIILRFPKGYCSFESNR